MCVLFLIQANPLKVYELHGGCKSGTCIDCKKKYPIAEIKELKGDSPYPICSGCNSKHVKVDVILFGEQLPEGPSPSLL